jgi:hypothetical protein
MADGALGIKLRCTSWQQLATIYKRDLSQGTMFLKASNPPPVGTTVRIDLELPSASVIVLTGVIHRHVSDPQRGNGVELKLRPIPTGSIWMIESALSASDARRPPTGGFPATPTPSLTGAIPTLTEGGDVAEAEQDLIAALLSEADSLKKLNPFLVLGVGYEASDPEIRAAFGELTKRYHPDRFARYQSLELRQTAAEIFILIRDAYHKLGDEVARGAQLAALGRTPAAPKPAAKLPSVPAPPPRKTPAIGIPIIRPPTPTGPSTSPLPLTPPRPAEPARQSQALPKLGDAPDPAAVEDMLDAGRYEDALAAYKLLTKKFPQDRPLRAGIELCEGLRSLANRDRLEAAQRFEAALEIDPSNERAARELAEMRRQATNERKGLLSRLMGKKEPPP